MCYYSVINDERLRQVKMMKKESREKVSLQMKYCYVSYKTIGVTLFFPKKVTIFLVIIL